MAKTITLRIDEIVYRFLLHRAKSEKRSLSNYIEVSAVEYSKEAEFADESEMTEIYSNKPLLKRLKQGSRDAKAMKGRFVG